MGLNDEHSRTSRLKALTAPQRWGLERVQEFFGKIVVCRVQTCIPGDVLRDKQTGLLYLFEWREGEDLGLRAYTAY